MVRTLGSQSSNRGSTPLRANFIKIASLTSNRKAIVLLYRCVFMKFLANKPETFGMDLFVFRGVLEGS